MMDQDDQIAAKDPCIATRLAMLADRLDKAHNCDWLELVFASDFTVFTGRNAADANAAFIGITQLPGYANSRWTANDFAGLAPLLRQTVIKYFEDKIAELKQLQ